MAKDKICRPFVGIIAPENKFTVDTIDDLKSRNYLTVGDIVDLNGYYTAGDGAHHKRKIESADDGSGVQLANGLWANIVHNGEVNVSWFGENTRKAYEFEAKRNGDKKISLTSHSGRKLDVFSDGEIELNYTGTSGVIVSDSELRRTNINVNEVEKITQAILGGGKIKIQDSSIKNMNGMAMQFNNGQSEIAIKNSVIDSGGYGVLINSSSRPEKYIIRNNEITSFNADAVEINVPNSEDYIAKFGLISKNIISSKDERTTATGTSAGFAIGVAQGLNTIVEGNYIKDSRLEAIHFEDCSKDSIVANNIVKTSYDGCRLLYKKRSDTLKSNSPLLSSNIFVKNGEKGGVGINSISNPNGQHPFVNISQCSFENFDTVISRGKVGSFLTVENCNVVGGGYVCSDVVVQGAFEKINRSNSVSNLPIFYKSVHIEDRLEDTEFAKITTEQSFIIYNSLSYGIVSNTQSSGVAYPRHTLMRMPCKYDGYISLDVQVPSSGVRGSAVFKVKIENGVLIESTRTHIQSIGAFSDINIVREGDFLKASHYFNGNMTKMHITINFYNTLLLYPESTSMPEDTSFFVVVSKFMNTPYHATKMQQLGIYEDFISYMDSQHEYDKEQKALESAKQEAYQLALAENSELVYEDWLASYPELMPVHQEPVPSKALQEFYNEYK